MQPCSEGFAELDELKSLVIAENACALPGVSVRFEEFVSYMWFAVSKGFVSRDHAEFIQDGLQNGFMAGVDLSSLRGRRVFKNYKSALDHRPHMTKAILKRVEKNKTLYLGEWHAGVVPFDNFTVFAMGAVSKSIDGVVIDEMRPTSDHTASGLNAATDMTFLRHSVTSYKDIARFLRPGYWMRVSDVDGAFPLLPFHYDLWPHMLFRCYSSDEATSLSLFCHLCGDFGTAGMPGVFKIFFVDALVPMARCAGVLSLNLAVHVD